MNRKFHGFCLGSGKTGTASVASMFQRFRSAHEPMPALTNQIVIEYDKQDLKPNVAQRLLRCRDDDLQLEMDASHPLGFIPKLLARTFPNSKFLITVRHPLEWVKSRMAYHLAVDPPAWRPFRQHFWRNRPEDYSIHDEYLATTYHLCPLDAYLGVYEEQYTRLWNETPYDQAIIVKTESLSNSHALKKIAQFFEVPYKHLVKSHLNKTNKLRVDPSSLLTDDYIMDRSNAICHRALETYHAAI